MNQPQEPRFDKLEQRVENLEQTFKEVIKNEEQLIRLSQRHRLNTQELKAITGRIELDIEDSTVRLDKIEAGMATKQDIAVLKAITEHIQLDIGDSRERFDKIEVRLDKIEAGMTTKQDITVLETTMATQKEDISALKTTMAIFETTQTEHGELLRQILARLEPR